ncbi:unnamed protein product [Ambrosiozyma monospora]|uniref:Unnamed protein product n=1 Tax=Ambrosiozyma monospora TaxID=43982 RepID=A0A9W6YTK0_AMBMO|nr:unnamed protein product [Ambrosiozyma monospora]
MAPTLESSIMNRIEEIIETVTEPRGAKPFLQTATNFTGYLKTTLIVLTSFTTLDWIYSIFKGEQISSVPIYSQSKIIGSILLVYLIWVAVFVSIIPLGYTALANVWRNQSSVKLRRLGRPHHKDINNQLSPQPSTTLLQ